MPHTLYYALPVYTSLYDFSLSSSSTVYTWFNTATENDVVVFLINDDDDDNDEDGGGGGGDVLIVHWVLCTGGKIVHYAEKGIQTQRNPSILWKQVQLFKEWQLYLFCLGCRKGAVWHQIRGAFRNNLCTHWVLP